MSLNELQDGTFTRSLIDWYWSLGANRSGKSALATGWLLHLHDLFELQTVAAQASSRERGGVAVWGPSQTGKSTLLSQFLDDPNSPESAISWVKKKPYRFNKDNINFPNIDALNPFNQGSDASGCVTRFYLSDKCAHPAHPVRIVMGSRQSVMHALAAGYLLECDTESVGATGDGEIYWNESRFLEAIPKQLKSGQRVDRSAFEFAREVALTIERLMDDGQPRFVQLKAKWHSSLKKSWMSAAGDLDSVRAAAMRILWDDRVGLTSLFNGLDAARFAFEGKFGDRPVYCSLDFANLLLDIDTFGKLHEAGVDSEAIKSRVMDACMSISGDDVLIGKSGKALFEGTEDFGLFQGLVWQVDVPLNQAFFASAHEDARSLLERVDVYDIPGVTRHDTAAAEARLNPDAGEASVKDLLSRVLKQGKTASIITRFAMERRFDGVMILVRAVDPPSKNEQLASGVEAIWRGIDPNYKKGGRIKVPTFLCMTFLAQLANELVRDGKANLSAQEKKYRNLGEMYSSDDVTFFATNYPHLPPGVLQNKDRMGDFFKEIKKDPWFKKKFSAPDSIESFRQAMTSNDGGVGHFLRSIIIRLGDSAIQDFVEDTKTSSVRTLDGLLKTALPSSDGDIQATQAALEAFKDGIYSSLNEAGSGADRVVPISNDLLNIFGVSVDELTQLPRSWTQLATLRSYIIEQMGNWEESTKRRALLSGFGLEESQVRLILSALAQRVDVEDMAAFLRQFVPKQLTSREASHLRQYVAVKLTNTLFSEPVDRRYISTAGDDYVEVCQKKLDTWVDGERIEDAPQYELVVGPALALIDSVQAGLISNDWEPQPGDQELQEMMRNWQDKLESTGVQL